MKIKQKRAFFNARFYFYKNTNKCSQSDEKQLLFLKKYGKIKKL